MNSVRSFTKNVVQDTVDTYVDMCFSDDVDSEEWDLNEFNGVLTPIIPVRPLTAESVKGKKRDEIRHELKEEAVKLYEEKEAEFPEPEQLRELERVVLLKCIDSKWMDHIDDMEILRQGIGLAAYGQRDPVVEYKMSAFDMFNEMITSIQEDTLRMLYHVHVEQKIVEAVRNINSAVDVRIRPDSFISVEKIPISVCGEFITTERAVRIL